MQIPRWLSCRGICIIAAVPKDLIASLPYRGYPAIGLVLRPLHLPRAPVGCVEQDESPEVLRRAEREPPCLSLFGKRRAVQNSLPTVVFLNVILHLPHLSAPRVELDERPKVLCGEQLVHLGVCRNCRNNRGVPLFRLLIAARHKHREQQSNQHALLHGFIVLVIGRRLRFPFPPSCSFCHYIPT